MAKITASFTLDSRSDRDLLQWLDGVPKGQRSEEIRATLRAGLNRGGVTLGDVYQAIKALERKVQAGEAMVNKLSRQDCESSSEDAAAAAALDRLAEI
jgi:hypothetical protein